MAEKAGLAAALDVLAEAGEIGGFEREPELPLGPTNAQRATAAAGYRGPGRPPNSRNRRTAEMLEYLRSKGYADPLEVLAATCSRPAWELAAEIGCTVAEAFDRQQWAADKMLPYWHSKAPIEIDAKGALVAPLVMLLGDSAQAAAMTFDGTTMTLDPVPIEDRGKSDG